MGIDYLNSQVNELVEQYIEENMTEYATNDMHIDRRAAPALWANRDGIAIRSYNKGSFNYYAGAEYIDKEYVKEMGDYVFYSSEDARVNEWLIQCGLADADEDDDEE